MNIPGGGDPAQPLFVELWGEGAPWAYQPVKGTLLYAESDWVELTPEGVPTSYRRLRSGDAVCPGWVYAQPQVPAKAFYDDPGSIDCQPDWRHGVYEKVEISWGQPLAGKIWESDTVPDGALVAGYPFGMPQTMQDLENQVRNELSNHPGDYPALMPWADHHYGGDSPDPTSWPSGPTGPELRGPDGTPAIPNAPRCKQADPVDCATGNFAETQHDLTVGGLGGLDLARTYNAQTAATSPFVGRFGFGWADNYSQHLVFDPLTDTVTVVDAVGAELAFNPNGDGTYTSAPWVQATLRHNADNTYDYTLPDRSSLHFSAAGRLIETRDPNGNATVVDYDNAGRVSEVTAPGGRSITLTYNSLDLVETATSTSGREVQYAYNGADLSSVTDVRGGKWTFSYDAQHRMTKMHDPRGHEVANTYDAQDRVTSQSDRLGKTTTFAYGQGTTTVTDPEGDVTETTFVDNVPTTVVTAQGSDDEATKHIAYDDAKNPITVTDGRGHQTHYTYDAGGNRTSRTDPLDRETTWTYNSDHDVLTQTLPSGLTASYAYDAHGNVTSLTKDAPGAADQVTTFDYDSAGDLTQRTDPLDHSWTYTYNSHGDRVTATSPLGHETSYAHDDDGFVTSTVSPRGHVSGADPADFTTTYERNAAGQPTEITDQLGHETTFAYDANGNTTSTADADGRTTTTTFDAEDHPTAVERGDGSTTHTAYDDNGDVISRTDGEGHQTTYARDAQRRVVTSTDPNDRATHYQYDDVGNRTAVIDADGRTTTSTYDDANQLTDISDSSGHPGDVSISYTADGLSSSMTDDSGTSHWTYDPLDRLTSTESGAGQHVGYHYDAANRLTSIDYPDALVPAAPEDTPDTVSAGTVTRGYDADDRLTSVEDWLDNETTFAYNVDGALTSTERPDDTIATRTVDRADRLTYIDDVGTHYSFSADYTRTDADLLASATETGDGAGPAAGYSHDDAARLTGSGTGNQSFDYDDADNPTQLVDGSDTHNQTFDDTSQLTRIANASDATIATLDYDNEGDRTSLTPTSGTATSYSYDQALELTQYQGVPASGGAAITQTYGYDGTGLRQYTQTAGVRTHHTWDLSGGLPLMIQDGANSYLYGPEGVPIEQVTATGQAHYYHHDQLGSTRALTDQDGQPVATYSYTPYGALKASTGSANNPFGYAGQYTDVTGLQYLRARYYDAATAEFLTRDPLEATTRQPYAYASDDPTDLTDPTGGIFGIPGTPSFGEAGGYVLDHSGAFIGVGTFAACIVVSAGTCAGAVLAGTVVNGIIIATTRPSDEIAGDELLNAVGGLVGGAAPTGLWKAGDEAVPRLLRPAVNYITGLPAGILGLLDPHVDECGELA